MNSNPIGDMIGQVVLVRTFSAGVHVGTLEVLKCKVVRLKNARIIWRWRGANTLHELANHGADMQHWTRISEPVDDIVLTEAIEIIPVHPDAVDNLLTSRWLI